jgi:hypothetical protein
MRDGSEITLTIIVRGSEQNAIVDMPMQVCGQNHQANRSIWKAPDADMKYYASHKSVESFGPRADTPPSLFLYMQVRL